MITPLLLSSRSVIGCRLGFDMRSFVQQQDHYPFYAFPVLDVPPGATTPPDSTTDLIPSHTTFGMTRRLGNAYARLKVPKVPVHLFVKGDWQARAGLSQLAYLDENTTPRRYNLRHPMPLPERRLSQFSVSAGQLYDSEHWRRGGC